MSQIVWLASYPKSGNTWFRVFLTNFLGNGSAPANINDLAVTWNAAFRDLVDNALVVACSDLTADELAWYRPQAYRNIGRRSHETRYFKVHDAYTCSPDGEPLFPADVTRGAVYLVRDPLDVSVSFAHHYGLSVDDAIERMGRESWVMAGSPGRVDGQLTQRMLTWSQHVLSWLDQAAFPVHLMRYEDMLRQTVETFGAALRFLGLPDEADRVLRAVEFSSFGRLREQEQANGFREKPIVAASFFREGRAGAWRASLTKVQVNRIVGDHGVVMQRLGYLSGEGLPQDV